MSEKYLISLDLDGTLLNSKNSITKYSEEIIKKTIALGHKVMIASGRAPRAIRKYYNQLELDTPIVCYNGAKIYDPKDANFNDIALKFPKEKILRFCSEFADIVPGITCENEDTIWTNEDDEYLFKFYIKDYMKFNLGNIHEILNKDPIIFIGKYIDTPENRERIISEKANRIYRIQSKGVSNFTLDHCRELPLNAGSLYSLIVKLLLGKDVEFEKEKAMMDYHFGICEELLEEVGGGYAFISVGHNYYGHPATETLEALERWDYNIYRTDEVGNIDIRIGK